MSSNPRPTPSAGEITQYVPYLRRYARALCGSQQVGDTYVRATLECLIEQPELLRQSPSTVLSLYRLFHTIWARINQGVGTADAASEREQRMQRRLMELVPRQRQALLLTAMEGFTLAETAEILQCDEATLQQELSEAESGLSAQVPARVMIIEDETIIALDLRSLVRDLGHTVTSIARTHREAVEQAAIDNPELILADIQLADGSSGLDAVREILADTTLPVIFITAYPERLLTGTRPEPTYLITKPFNPEMVRATMAQALLFHRAEPDTPQALSA